MVAAESLTYWMDHYASLTCPSLLTQPGTISILFLLLYYLSAHLPIIKGWEFWEAQ